MITLKNTYLKYESLILLKQFENKNKKSCLFLTKKTYAGLG